jgi:hypothetical protein
MSQQEVYNLLKKEKELNTTELIKRLSDKCGRHSILRSLRVMKKYGEIELIEEGWRTRIWRIITEIKKKPKKIRN